MSNQPAATSTQSIAPLRPSEQNEKRLCKVDNELKKKWGADPLTGEAERLVAAGAVAKSARSDFTDLVKAIGLLIPAGAAWVVAGGGTNVLFAGAVAAVLVCTAAVLIYKDGGVSDAVAAVLEHRSKQSSSSTAASGDPTHQQGSG